MSKSSFKPMYYQILDEAAQQFLDDGDVIDACEEFVRGQRGDQEFLERMIFLRQAIRGRAEDAILRGDPEGTEGDSLRDERKNAG